MARRRKFPLVPVLGIALLAAVGWALAGSDWFRSEGPVQVRGAPVQRGPLRISVIEKGNLKAADYVSLRSELERRTTILYLIPEGTSVAPGDLVCELDATELVDRRVEQQISVRNAEAAYVKSKQNYDIQKSQNESDIARAEQNLAFAHEDIKKYREGDRILAEERALETITLANEEHTRAQEKVEWSIKLAEKGFLTATELEADRLSLTRAKIQLDQAIREERILGEYEIPRQLAELEADLEEAQRELVRVKLQAAARLVDYEADLSTNEAKLNLEKEELRKLVEQIDKAKIYAPKGGMVVYAQEDSSRFGGSRPMAEGNEVRERQEIVTIPSPGGMVAEASLHETFLEQVQPGQPCVVKVDALAGRIFRGQVSFVALLPDQNSWWANPNTRLYRSEIKILDGSSEMRPGMSCSVEIVVEDLEDALYVPIQAVFRDRSRTLCYVDREGQVEAVDVETGLYNDTWVEIRGGLQEGQVVLLSRPVGFEHEDSGEEEGSEVPFWGTEAEGAGEAGPGDGKPAAAADVRASGQDGEGRAGMPDMTRMRELIQKAKQGDAEATAELKRMRERAEQGGFGGQGGSSPGGAPRGGESDGTSGEDASRGRRGDGQPTSAAPAPEAPSASEPAQGGSAPER